MIQKTASHWYNIVWTSLSTPSIKL